MSLKEAKDRDRFLRSGQCAKDSNKTPSQVGSLWLRRTEDGHDICAARAVGSASRWWRIVEGHRDTQIMKEDSVLL